MNIAKLTTLSSALALASLACDARTLIGMVPDGSAPDDNGSTVVDGSPSAPDAGGGLCTPLPATPFTTPAGIAGTWTGFTQGGNFAPLISDAVKLVIDKAADGSDQIHVFFGATVAPPPPATSATELYPPGLPQMQASLLTLFEGFPYVARDVKWQPFGTQWRLTFLVYMYQGWESWCRMQTSYPVDSPGTYNCIPGSGVMYTNAGQANEECTVLGLPSGPQPVNCAQAQLCDGLHCTCDACGCDAGFRGGPNFDLLFDGDMASGGNVHLMRSN